MHGSEDLPFFPHALISYIMNKHLSRKILLVKITFSSRHFGDLPEKTAFSEAVVLHIRRGFLNNYGFGKKIRRKLAEFGYELEFIYHFFTGASK